MQNIFSPEAYFEKRWSKKSSTVIKSQNTCTKKTPTKRSTLKRVYKEESVTESDSEKENNTGKKVKSDLSKICGSPNVKWTDIKGNEITIELLRDSLSNPRDFPTIYKVNRYLTTCMKTN
jgi:SpoVK/Ycf46/Vps4 family AAA+-type ATPase